MKVSTKEDVAAQIERALTTLLRGPRIRRLHESLNLRASVDLDRPSYVALASLDDDGPMRVTELADACGVDASTVSRLVDRLLTAGLLERGEVSADRRVVVVQISDDGRTLLRRLKAVRRQGLSEVLSEWSDGEQEAFAGLLTRFVEDVERLALPHEA